jgi:hypothetical protein
MRRVGTEPIWAISSDNDGRVRKAVPTKAELTKGDALEKAVGPEGGSVRIKKANGKYQEERTFPKSKDPSKSPG